MKIYLAIFLSMVSLAATKAQMAPIKWATQETFFEELVGKDLPEFKGLTVNHAVFNSKNLNNQIVVINFWFEKCPPCIAEMPELNKWVEKYGKGKVRFIAITYDLPKVARKFQKKNGYRYEIISLTHNEIRKLNINHGFPSNILVGKDGKILYATANISFFDDASEIKAKSVLFEEKLKTEMAKANK